MAIQQTVTKYKDVYTLLNGGVTSFSYSLLLINCGERTEVITGVLTPTSLIALPIVKDGNYELVLVDGTETITTKAIIIKIVFRKNLLLSIVKSLKKVLCNCACKNCDCEEESVSCELHKLITYVIAKPEYNETVQQLLPYFECRLIEGSECTITNEFIYGKTKCDVLEKNLLTLYYLAIYLYDFKKAFDVSEKNYVTTIMNYLEIQKCIKKMGIFIDLNQFIIEPINEGIFENQFELQFE